MERSSENNVAHSEEADGSWQASLLDTLLSVLIVTFMDLEWSRGKEGRCLEWTTLQGTTSPTGNTISRPQTALVREDGCFAWAQSNISATMLSQAETVARLVALAASCLTLPELPTLRGVLPSRTVVVAFNSGSDKACLKRSLLYHKLPQFDDIYWVCCMSLARRLFPALGKKTSLHAICDCLHID